jgi:hypothetical protein
LRAGGGGVGAADSDSGTGAGVTVMLLTSWAEGDAAREKGGDEMSDEEGSDWRRAPGWSWLRWADMAMGLQWAKKSRWWIWVADGCR